MAENNHVWIYLFIPGIIQIDMMQSVVSYNSTDISSLHRTLFKDYNNNVLPDYPVNVCIEYNLLTINSLESVTQTLTTSGWFTITWTDSRLKWTDSSFRSHQHIYVSQSSIWYPELIVENSVKDLTAVGEDNIKLRISSDGEVKWQPPAILETSCDMDVTLFPFDVQSCDIQVASWGFYTDAVNVTFLKNEINIVNYYKNGEWDLMGSKQISSEIIDEQGLKFSKLIFQVKLKRLPGHYIINIIFPVILTTVLTLMVFMLPVESGEKVGYTLTVLLALAVFLNLFAGRMPTTSKHTSFLAIFLVVSLGFSFVVIFCTILIIRLHYRKDKKASSNWMSGLSRSFVKPFYDTDSDNKQCSNNASLKHLSDHDHVDKQHPANASLKHPTDQDRATNKESLYNEKIKQGKTGHQDLARFLDIVCFCLFSSLYLFVVVGFFISVGILVDH